MLFRSGVRWEATRHIPGRVGAAFLLAQGRAVLRTLVARLVELAYLRESAVVADRSPPWRDAASAAVEVWSEGDRPVIGLFGEHDLASEAELLDALARFCGVGTVGDVVVDLSEATFIDSTTIASLIGGRNLMHSQGRSLLLRAPSPQARRVLELCGLLVYFEPTTAVTHAPGPR